MENILEIKNLNKKYENFQLKDINLSIPKGSIVGLIGENGAGKSTIIKSILNIVVRDSGDIKIFGKDSKDYEKEIKQNLGIVLDEKNFQETFTPLNINKIMTNLYRDWNEKKFMDFMEKFKLPKNQKIKEYSKGMKMKLAISVALSNDNQLLILDEPTVGLDPVVRNEILDELLDYVQDENKSILFSTHITSDLDKIADYITFIHEGRVVFSKNTEEILSNYGLLKCSLEESEKLDQEDIVGFRKNKFGFEGLVKDRDEARRKYPDLLVDKVNIEEVMLYHIRGDK